MWKNEEARKETKATSTLPSTPVRESVQRRVGFGFGFGGGVEFIGWGCGCLCVSVFVWSQQEKLCEDGRKRTRAETF